jgi:hypothetical protein
MVINLSHASAKGLGLEYMAFPDGFRRLTRVHLQASKQASKQASEQEPMLLVVVHNESFSRGHGAKWRWQNQGAFHEISTKYSLDPGQSA